MKQFNTGQHLARQDDNRDLHACHAEFSIPNQIKLQMNCFFFFGANQLEIICICHKSDNAGTLHQLWQSPLKQN